MTPDRMNVRYMTKCRAIKNPNDRTVDCRARKCSTRINASTLIQVSQEFWGCYIAFVLFVLLQSCLKLYGAEQVANFEG
jgi:hypothetical protein